MYVESLNYVFHTLYCTTCSKVVALRKNRCQNGRTLVRIGAGQQQPDQKINGKMMIARCPDSWEIKQLCEMMSNDPNVLVEMFRKIDSVHK